MSISRRYCKKTSSSIIIAVVLASVFVAAINIRVIPPAKADANWLAGWQYRKSHVINSAIGAGTNYQVMITVHYGSGADSGGDVFCNGHSRTDFGDVRFTATDGSTLLSYWMQSFVAGNNAVFWVKITDDLSSQARTVYVYYGKSDAITTSNGDNTFILFQDSFLLGAPNNASYLNIPTYDGSGQLAHLDIYYNAGGWHGHKYWMVMTPYPNGDATKENPSIVVSEDGQSWSVPGGLSNPIVPYPGSGRHNCDPDLVYNPDTDELWVYFLDALDGATSYVKLAKSSDGVTWSSPSTVITVSDVANIVSPSVIKIGSNWRMWTVNTHGLGWSAADTNVELRTSVDGTNWGLPINVTGITPTGFNVWHSNVVYVPSLGEFWASLGSYKDGQQGDACDLFMAKSSDGTSWTVQNFLAVRKGGAGAWDSGGLYRSVFLYDSTNSIFRVWYVGHTNGNTGVWRLGYTATNTVSAFNRMLSSGWWHPWSKGITRQVGNYIRMSDVPTSETTEEGIQTTSAVFQAGRALYFKAYRTGTTSSGTVLGSSKYNTGVNDDAVTLFVYTSTVYARTRVGGTQTQSSVSLPGATEGVYKILWISGSSVRFYKDSTNVANSATNIPSSPLCVSMYDYDSGATLWVDWVFIRSCVSVEPSHGSWGSEEENLPPPIPANPILVIVNSSTGSFSGYIGEILKAEGFNEFQTASLSQISPSFLASFDTVILATLSLSSLEATMIQNYVSAGGNLIAFKPDAKLAPIFGLVPAHTTLSEGYIKVDDTTDIGKGIVNETIQFHGTADNYDLNRSSVIATLYSNAVTPTPYPAVATYAFGYGQTVFFAYDFPKSIVLLRQGNPAYANQYPPGGMGGREALYVNYLNVKKIPVPQADEQMRLLTNAIMRMNYRTTPLPRLWYFPDFKKTMLIFTGDQEWAGTTLVNDELMDVEARGGKMSLYLTTLDSPGGVGSSWNSLADVQNWTNRGHDIGWHVVTGASYASMDNSYTNQFSQFNSLYGRYPIPTMRHHGTTWFGYVEPAKIEQLHGVRMDFNGYHVGSFIDPGDGLGPRNGWMTGSGLPMRFADQNGTIVDVYQVMTQWPDDLLGNGNQGRQSLNSTQAIALFDKMFNQSRDGFYSAFCTNFHPLTWTDEEWLQIWGMLWPARERKLAGQGVLNLAQNYGIPIWSGKQLLDFTDARDRATFENISYSTGRLNFSLALPLATNNLTVMIPYSHEGRTLESISLNSSIVPFVTETLKGIEYALFKVNSFGRYEVRVNYGPDTNPPEIVVAFPVNGTLLSANTTSVTITVTTNEYADCRYSTTNPLFDYVTAGTDFTSGQGMLSHSFTLSGLLMGRTYSLYYKARDTSGNINSLSTLHTFSIAINDETPPEWRNQGQNEPYVPTTGSNVLYAQARDDYGLNYGILSTNETGIWRNITWWDTSWPYRKSITLTDTSGSTLLDYQVRLLVNYVPTKMRSDFSDLRFTGSDQMTPIPCWIESYTPSSSAWVWVRVPRIPASGLAKIYMYYGNPGATDASDGMATFEFFDYFTGNALDTNKWTINAVNQITYNVNNYFRFKDATKSYQGDPHEPYWIYDGNDTGSQIQAKWTPLSQFVVEFNSKLGDTDAVQMGEGMVGLIASDNTLIGGAGHQDWDSILIPTRGAITKNLASSMGTGVSRPYSWAPYMVWKTCSATDTTSWKIVYDGSTLKFYDGDGFFAQTSVTASISKLALVAGAYAWTNPIVTYLDYIQMDGLRVRKYSSSEPTNTVGSEETREGPLSYYHNSPIQLGGVAGTWVWSNFTWNNPTIQEGTTIAWKIWFEDASGNWNSTGTMIFFVGAEQPMLGISPSLTEKSFGDVGTTFRVSVTVEDVVDLYGFDFSLTWDSSLLTLSTVDFTSALDNIWGHGKWFVAVNHTGTGSYNLVAVSTATGFTSTPPAVLAQLTFLVKDPQSNFLRQTSIHFDTHKLSDANAVPIEHMVQDGTYQISGANPALDLVPTAKTCRKYGEISSFRINMSNAYDVEDFEFEVRFDTALLNYSSVTWNAWGSGTVSVDEAGGRITGSTSGSRIGGTQALVTVQFKASYYHIWKNEATVPGWINNQTGTIFIQWANVSYPTGPDRRYEKGVLNEIEVGSDVVYTWWPIKGDIYLDGTVDVTDLLGVANYYDVALGNPRWPSAQKYELTNARDEEIVDLYDLIIIASNYWFTYP